MRAYCSWFNFRSADQQKKVGVLSGGERNRLLLAKVLKKSGNLLLLDVRTPLHFCDLGSSNDTICHIMYVRFIAVVSVLVYLQLLSLIDTAC